MDIFTAIMRFIDVFFSKTWFENREKIFLEVSAREIVIREIIPDLSPRIKLIGKFFFTSPLFV